MRNFTRSFLLASTVCLAADQAHIRKRPIPYVASGDGAAMFQAYCASCHGRDAKGGGPAAKALKTAASDLTTLAQSNGGKFPALKMMNALGNIAGAEAHGSSDMPVWGDVFRAAGQNNAMVQARIHSLVQFVEAVQDPPGVPASPKPKAARKPRAIEIDATSGEAMYKSYCAACHGSDGRGFGPVAKSITPQLPDLTVLTRTHNGKFPDAHLADVLGLRGSTTAAHGSPDMPVWGNIFRGSREDSGRVHMRISNLVNYIKTLQQ